METETETEMTGQDLLDLLKKLPIRRGASPQADEKFWKIVTELVEQVVPKLKQKNWVVTMGSLHPTTTKRYVRLYLDKNVKGGSHLPGAKNNNTMQAWEWLTEDKYGFHPIPRRDILGILRLIA